jgi:hypothetical protein
MAKKKGEPQAIHLLKKAADNEWGAFLKENSVRFAQVKSRHETQIFKRGKKQD